MVDASVPDLPKSEYKQILDKMNARFLPALNNEEARKRFSEIIDESWQAVVAEWMEEAHKVGVWFKS